MNSSSRRRFRVVARPKTRVRRARALAAFAALAALGAVAFVTLRKLVADFRLPIAAAARADGEIVVEGPEPLRSLAQAAADAVPGTAGEKAEALKARYPSLSDIRVRRNWTEKQSTLTLVVRRAIAPATRRGRHAGFLGDDGTVFTAPPEAFVVSAPPVETAGASAAELAALAREWPRLTAASAFPSPLTGLSYVSAEDGWEAILADGTRVQWGRLEWTNEKLARLSEALADARQKDPGSFSADLRWFEDGKVLLKPYQARPIVAHAGKMR